MMSTNLLKRVVQDPKDCMEAAVELSKAEKCMQLQETILYWTALNSLIPFQPHYTPFIIY